MDMVALCPCLKPSVTATPLRPWSRIPFALLVMTGRISMLGLARWAGNRGSYRTVQRFFSTLIPWATRLWVVFRPHVYGPEEVYLLAGDDVVVTKAGQTTDGLDRFCSSVHGKPGPGLACFTLSLVSVQARRAFPLRVEQVVRSAAEKAASQAKAAAKKPKSPGATRRPGRPPGRTNTHKAHVTLTPELLRLTAMLDALLPLIAQVVPLTYLVLDGHFGHHNALHMVRQANVPLSSQLRCDAALYFPYTGPAAGRGPHRQ
jgi:putative transposase